MNMQEVGIVAGLAPAKVEKLRKPTHTATVYLTAKNSGTPVTTAVKLSTCGGLIFDSAIFVNKHNIINKANFMPKEAVQKLYPQYNSYVLMLPAMAKIVATHYKETFK